MSLDKAGLERLWQHIIVRLGDKVDKDGNKGLSTCDFTQEEKDKLAAVSYEANKNVQTDWNNSDPTSDAFIKNMDTEKSIKTILTWDGNPTEEIVNIGGQLLFYRISDLLLTDDYSQYTITLSDFHDPENKISYNLQDITVEDDGEGILIFQEVLIFMVYNTNSSNAAMYGFTELGIYCLDPKFYGFYLSEISGPARVLAENMISDKIARKSDFIPATEDQLINLLMEIDAFPAMTDKNGSVFTHNDSILLI